MVSQINGALPTFLLWSNYSMHTDTRQMRPMLWYWAPLSGEPCTGAASRSPTASASGGWGKGEGSEQRVGLLALSWDYLTWNESPRSSWWWCYVIVNYLQMPCFPCSNTNDWLIIVVNAAAAWWVWEGRHISALPQAPQVWGQPSTYMRLIQLKTVGFTSK